MKTDNPVVLSWTQTVILPFQRSSGVGLEEAQQALNKAHGFHSTSLEDEVPEACRQAHVRLHQTQQFQVRVSLHKDGTKTITPV